MPQWATARASSSDAPFTDSCAATTSLVPELQWSKQNATDLQCTKCQRTYNIDGEYGYVKEGNQGHALTQYRNVRYTPDNGLLIVSNP